MRTKIRKIRGKIRIIDRNLRENEGKVRLLPTQDCEASYAPGPFDDAMGEMGAP